MGQTIMYFLKQYGRREILVKLVYLCFMVLVLMAVLLGTLDRHPEQQKDAIRVGIDEPLPDEFLEIYKEFEIVRYNGKYYALAVPVDLTDRGILTVCQATYQCVTGAGLEEVKQLVDILVPDQANFNDLADLSSSSVPDNVSDLLDLTNLVEKIETSSSYSPYGPELLLDGGPENVHAWHSEEEPDYPLWIDVVFRTPVSLEGIGLQAQVGSLDRAPRYVRILQGKDFNSQPGIFLTFDFISDGGWSYHRLPKMEEFQHHRILIMDNHGDTQFVTIQELRFYGQVDEPALIVENYKGFNILWYKNEFYVLPQTLESVDLTQLDESSLNEYQTLCLESDQCGIADSLEEAKRLANQLN